MGITCEGLIFMIYSTPNIDRGIPVRGLQRSMFLSTVPLCTQASSPIGFSWPDCPAIQRPLLCITPYYGLWSHYRELENL